MALEIESEALDFIDTSKSKNTRSHLAFFVTDLINGLVEILRLETAELQDAVRETFAPVKP